jgi:hypothetical protein
MSEFWGGLLLFRVFAKLITEASIDQVVHTDICSHTARDELTVIKQYQAFNIMRLAAEN